MEIAFRTQKLRKTLNDERALTRFYGAACGRKIARRLVTLAAAACLADVPATPPERRHQLRGNKDEAFAADVQQPYRLVFRVADDPIPRQADGGIDVRRVTAITVLAVEDYH